MRFGVQMFGINPIFIHDKEYFLSRITAAGYRYLEPCLIFQSIPALKDRFWTPEDLEANLPLLKKYGVKIHSCHVFSQDIQANLELLIPLAKKFGIEQVVLPCPKFQSAKDGACHARKLTAVANTLRGEDIELLLHNGGTDSVTQIDGVSAYEWLLGHCGDSVGVQADVGWLLYGGTDPESFLWRNKEKVRSLHYKDMEQTESGMSEIAVGRGLVDMKACFQFAEATEIIQLVDQDSSRGDFFEDLDFVGKCFRELVQVGNFTRSQICAPDTEI